MAKREWLDTMRETLMAEIPQSEIDNNIAYYRDYIDRESTTKTEQEVLEALGDPRLIARTIIDTYSIQRGTTHNSGYYDANNYDYSDAYQRTRADRYETVDEEGNVESGQTMHYHITNIKWYHKILFGIVMALILFVALFIGGIVLRLTIRIGLPILIVIFLYQMIRRK